MRTSLQNIASHAGHYAVNVRHTDSRRQGAVVHSPESSVQYWQPVLGLRMWTIRVELVGLVCNWQSGNVKTGGVARTALVLTARITWWHGVSQQSLCKRPADSGGSRGTVSQEQLLDEACVEWDAVRVNMAENLGGHEIGGFRLNERL